MKICARLLEKSASWQMQHQTCQKGKCSFRWTTKSKLDTKGCHFHDFVGHTFRIQLHIVPHWLRKENTNICKILLAQTLAGHNWCRPASHALLQSCHDFISLCIWPYRLLLQQSHRICSLYRCPCFPRSQRKSNLKLMRFGSFIRCRVFLSTIQKDTNCSQVIYQSHVYLHLRQKLAAENCRMHQYTAMIHIASFQICLCRLYLSRFCLCRQYVFKSWFYLFQVLPFQVMSQCLFRPSLFRRYLVRQYLLHKSNNRLKCNFELQLRHCHHIQQPLPAAGRFMELRRGNFDTCSCASCAAVELFLGALGVGSVLFVCFSGVFKTSEFAGTEKCFSPSWRPSLFSAKLDWEGPLSKSSPPLALAVTALPAMMSLRLLRTASAAALSEDNDPAMSSKCRNLNPTFLNNQNLFSGMKSNSIMAQTSFQTMPFQTLFVQTFSFKTRLFRLCLCILKPRGLFKLYLSKVCLFKPCLFRPYLFRLCISTMSFQTVYFNLVFSDPVFSDCVFQPCLFRLCISTLSFQSHLFRLCISTMSFQTVYFNPVFSDPVFSDCVFQPCLFRPCLFRLCISTMSFQTVPIFWKRYLQSILSLAPP